MFAIFQFVLIVVTSLVTHPPALSGDRGILISLSDKKVCQSTLTIHVEYTDVINTLCCVCTHMRARTHTHTHMHTHMHTHVHRHTSTQVHARTRTHTHAHTRTHTHTPNKNLKITRQERTTC